MRYLALFAFTWLIGGRVCAVDVNTEPVAPRVTTLGDFTTVCHEIGHALYSYLNGYTIDHIAVARDQLIRVDRGVTTTGAVFFKYGRPGTEHDRRWHNCALSMAGFAGELFCNGAIRVFGGLDVYDTVTDGMWITANYEPKIPWGNLLLPPDADVGDIAMECRTHALEVLTLRTDDFVKLAAALLDDEDGLMWPADIERLIGKP